MFNLLSKAPSSAKNDILSGLTVALALVPEAVAFAFVANVEPLVGLYAAFIVGLIVAWPLARKILQTFAEFFRNFSKNQQNFDANL